MDNFTLGLEWFLQLLVRSKVGHLRGWLKRHWEQVSRWTRPDSEININLTIIVLCKGKGVWNRCAKINAKCYSCRPEVFNLWSTLQKNMITSFVGKTHRKQEDIPKLHSFTYVSPKYIISKMYNQMPRTNTNATVCLQFWLHNLKSQSEFCSLSLVGVVSGIVEGADRSGKADLISIPNAKSIQIGRKRHLKANSKPNILMTNLLIKKINFYNFKAKKYLLNFP